MENKKFNETFISLHQPELSNEIAVVVEIAPDGFRERKTAVNDSKTRDDLSQPERLSPVS
jgi:hypothetical protein